MSKVFGPGPPEQCCSPGTTKCRKNSFVRSRASWRSSWPRPWLVRAAGGAGTASKRPRGALHAPLPNTRLISARLSRPQFSVAVAMAVVVAVTIVAMVAVLRTERGDRERPLDVVHVDRGQQRIGL